MSNKIEVSKVLYAMLWMNVAVSWVGFLHDAFGPPPEVRAIRADLRKAAEGINSDLSGTIANTLYKSGVKNVSEAAFKGTGVDIKDPQVRTAINKVGYNLTP